VLEKKFIEKLKFSYFGIKAEDSAFSKRTSTADLFTYKSNYQKIM
jgi:hypothetical protein